MHKKVSPRHSTRTDPIEPPIEEAIERQLTSAVLQFADKQLALCPRSIVVDSHDESITVTMTGVLSEAEKNAARAKDRCMMGLIVKNHTGSFKVVKRLLELMVAGITGRAVSNSALLLDPESDVATIILPFGK